MTPRPGPGARLRIAALAASGIAVVAGLALLGVPGIDAPEHAEASTSASASASMQGSALSPGLAPVDAALDQAESRVNTLIESLAARLKSRPDDVDGWRTLARSYAALGRHAAAIDACKAALRLRLAEPALLADCAFSAAVLDPHATSGESARLIAHALQLDPLQPKALALAATLALDRHDYPGAIAPWEQLARVEPADGPGARQFQLSILQTRQMAATRSGTLPR